jgi:hypothetical protein
MSTTRPQPTKAISRAPTGFVLKARGVADEISSPPFSKKRQAVRPEEDWCVKLPTLPGPEVDRSLNLGRLTIDASETAPYSDRLLLLLAHLP